MNNNNSNIVLSSQINLEFVETIIINDSNLNKFRINISNSKTLKTNTNDYYIYFNSDIEEERLDKQKLSDYIQNEISSNPNDSNIFIDSMNEFYEKNSVSNSSNSNKKPKLKFFDPDINKGSISMGSIENLTMAVKTMEEAANCISQNGQDLLNKIRGFDAKLDKSCASIKNGLNEIGIKLATITSWYSVGDVVNLYKSSFEAINKSFLDIIRRDYETKKASNELVLPNELKEAVGDEDYKFMQDEYIKEIDSLIADLTVDENGNSNIKYVDDAYKRLNGIQQKFVTSSKKEILIMLDPNIKSAADIKSEDLTAEQKQAQFEQILKNRDSLYSSLSDSTIGGMDRDVFDSLLLQDKDKLASMLAHAAALEAVSAVKGVELKQDETYNGVLSASINSMRDSYCSSSIGQERILGYFREQCNINDEYNATGNTEYIKFCISNNHTYDWLKPELRGIADTINRINNYDKFSSTIELSMNNPQDAEILKQIEECKVNNRPIPYGYEEKNGKYYKREYTSLGQQLLYYMDNHYAENTWNNGDNKFLTAFSNQGYVDAIERGFKNTWIENRIGNDIAKLGKTSEAYKNAERSAERDYYVLSGEIPDTKRKKELEKEGELSFSDLVKCINAADGDIKNLLDKDYVEDHKDEFAEILDSNSLWNINADLFSKNSLLYGIDTLGNSAIVALNEAIVGLSKFGENVIDAVNTAVHSDLFSPSYITFDENGNMMVDLSELDESHQKLFDKCWEQYMATGKYKSDFQEFFQSAYWKGLVASAIQNPETQGYYIKNVGTVYSLDNETLEAAARKLFINNKYKEWSVLDSSSSNQYMAAFKLGIRSGGDFSYLDNNISSAIKDAADKQFQTQLNVEVDKVGNFVQENIYNNEEYKFIEDNSFVKHDNILGMVFNQVGNMAIPIGISMIPGLAPSVLGAVAPAFKTLSSAALFTSAFGGAAEEAFNSGASYNEALKYATLSAATELAIEHVFSGIGGYGEGWADKLIEAGYDKIIPKSDGKFAKTIKQLITGGIGEAVEEVATDFVTPMWQSISYLNEKSYWEVLNENVSLESLAQTALVSFLSSMVFKGVEIKQQKSTYNKNYSKLADAIEKISGDKLDSTVMKKISDKVFGQYIDGIIENEGVIPSSLLEQLIKTASAEMLTANPEYAQELGKFQEQLKAFTNQKITIGEGKNSISITGAELLKLEDFTGFDGKYTIEDGKIKFENEKTQKAFNDEVFKMAKNNADSYNYTLGSLVASLKVSKDSIDIDGITTAIGTITEFGNFVDTSEVVLLEHNGGIILIPKAIAEKITTKLSIEEGKIKFKKDMNSGQFIQKLYDKAIGLCNEQIKKNTYDINKTIDKGLINKAIDAIKPALEQGNTSITVMNSTNVPENNLTKYDIKFNFRGISINVSVYIEGNTDIAALKQVDKINEMIQQAIFKNDNSSNIYLGQLAYDSKTNEMNIIKDNANALYVQSLELEARKTSGNMNQLQNVINFLNEISGNLKDSEIVTIQKDGKDVLISKSLLEEITSKYKIVDGKVEFTKDMSVEKFISAVYDKAIDLNNQKIQGIQNTNIKNATYVDTGGMDLYKLEVETIIGGETRTINVYVDGNTDISSIKDSTKVSEKLYELMYKNKNSNNVYAGQIVYNEKTGTINATENTANKLYVDSINAMSETNEHSEAVTSEEVIETTNDEVTPSEEIKKGESYEYTIEEVKEDETTKANSDEEIQEKQNSKQSVSTTVTTNVAEAAGMGITAGATSQAIYQNNVESSSVKDTSKAKNISPKSNTQVKENAHVETSNNSIININEIKSQVNSYIDSIKTECEKYIEMHKNDENFEHRFEQFKRDKIIELNDKLSEVRKTITDSNRAELNAINEKINFLSENDSLRDELISQRDELMNKQQQELADIETSANEKLQKVFSELNIGEKAELLGLTNEFANAITIEQKEFLTQISTEEGLIEYLQNNPLTKVELLERSELTHTDNKYVNKLIELINENKGINRQISNVEEVVKNNSNPIFEELSDAMNAKQKESIFDRLFGKFKSNNSIVSDGPYYIKLDKTLDDISISEVYKYLNNTDLLDSLLKGNVQNVDVPKLSSALKTMTMMKDHLGLNLDNSTLQKIEKLYKENIKRYFIENVEPKLPSIFKDYFALLNSYGGNHTLVIKRLESLGYSSERIVEGMLSYATSIGYNQEYSRLLYDRSCQYLRDIGYEHEKAARIVCDTYKEMLDLRGYDTITTVSGLTINIQKGLVWDNQAYTIDYIQNEIGIDKRMYKTNIPLTINLFDSFSYRDKLAEIQYNDPNHRAAASASENVINIFYNEKIWDVVLPHEYGHLIDSQITKDNKLIKRFSQTQEYLDAMNMDGNITTEYAASAGSVEDFAESIALIRKDMKAFQRKHPNRYRVISKYINLDFIPQVKSSSNVNIEMSTGANLSYQMNNAFKVLYETYGGDTAINTLVRYVQTGDISVVPNIQNLRSKIGSIDIRYIQNYLENNFNVKVEPMIQMTNGASLSYQMNNAFKVLYETYGGDTAINTLVRYVQTGDISVVPNIQNLRSKIGNIDIRYIQNYLENNFNVKVSNIELTMNVRKNLDIVYRTLEKSYGKSEALARLQNYIETGNLTVITRTDNARNIISRISIDDVIRYVNELKNSYSSNNEQSMNSSIITDSDLDFEDVSDEKFMPQSTSMNSHQIHLIQGDGISSRRGILGTHSKTYFDNIFKLSLDELRNIYNFIEPRKNGIIVSLSTDKNNIIRHPSIKGVYTQFYDYTIRRNNGTIKIFYNRPKTIVTNSKVLLKWQAEASNNIFDAIPSGIKIDENTVTQEMKLGMSNNGLFFQQYEDGNIYPIISMEQSKFDLLRRNGFIEMKIPVKIGGNIKLIDVVMDGSSSIKLFEYGPKLIQMVESEIKNNGYTPGDVINLGELQYNQITGTIEKVVNSNSAQVVNNTETTDVSYTPVVGTENTVLSSNDTSTASTNSDSDFLRKSEESSMSSIYVEDVQKNNYSNVEIENEPFNSAVLSTINIDGVEIKVETLKELQTPSVLDTALKTGEYAGVRVEKVLVELSKLDGVTLDSKLQELVKISESLKVNEIIFNIEGVYSNGVKPNIINKDVYNEFISSNQNRGISLDNLYEIINSNSVIYRLISNDAIIKNVSNESIKESLEYLLSISNRYNYENKVTREAQYLLNLLEDNYTTEELYDAFAIAHTEFNTPDIYYEFYDYLKIMDVDSAIKLLESKGYTSLDITDAFLNFAMRMDSQELSKKYYYKAFDYLVENGINEKEAATIITDKYRTLLYRRGTRVVATTPNGVEIKVVNNITSNNKLFSIEKIEYMIKQAEKYYSKTGLKEIVIFDSFAPHNIYSEKVQYEDYVKTHNNRRFVSAATATSSSISLWEDFDQLDSIVHEYGHTIDEHIKQVNKLVTDFSSSSTWLEAIQKDTAITFKRVSEYAYASNGEDFAEFLQYFNRNPLNVARKYPNRYKVASKYLNMEIDSDIIQSYLDSKQFFIEGIEDLSNLLTEDGSMLEFIKQYVFENLKGDNSIAKTVISELDAIYESRMEIMETYGVYSIFMDISEQERIVSGEFLKIIKDYLDGKDISSKFKDTRNLEIIKLLENEEIQEWYEEELNDMTAETEKIPVGDEDFEKMMNSLFSDSESNSSSDTSIMNDEKSTYNDSLIEDADVDMSSPKKSIFSKKIETVSVSDIPRVFRNMNTSDIISILEGKTTLKNDENFINNKKSIIRFVKYLSENNIKLSLNERANTIIENLRNGDFRLNILNFSDVLNGDAPIYGPSSINLDGIRISTDDVMVYLENKNNEIDSIITSKTPNEDARDLLNAIDELGSKNDIIYDKYRKSIKLIERIERSYVYRSYDSYYLLPMSFNGIDTSNILNSDLMSLTSYINSLSNADKKAYRVALDEFGKYIYKSNTRLSKQDLSRVNKLYDVINTKKFSTDTVIKSTVYDTFEMSYQNGGEFGSNQGKVREVIDKLGITNVIESLFDEKVERSKFLETLSELNISERDFITALTKRTQIGIMNDLFKDGDINIKLYSSLIKQVKINYPNMSTMEAVRFLYLIETKEAGGPGICNNPILVNMLFDKYIGKEVEFERDFGYPMYITANNGKKVLNEARLLVDMYSTLNDGVLVQNVNGKYVIETTNTNYVRTYDLNGLRLDAIEKFIKKKGINLNLSKTYFFNSNDELMHYDYLMEQIKSELEKGNYVIFGGRGFDMDVENYEFRQDVGAHGMTIVGIDTTGELILDSWGMKARVDLKKELSRIDTMFKDIKDNVIERIFTISSYNIS